MKQPSSEEESGWKSHRNCALGTWCINLQIADGDLCLKQNRSNKKTYIIQRHNHLVFSCKCFHIPGEFEFSIFDTKSQPPPRPFQALFDERRLAEAAFRLRAEAAEAAGAVGRWRRWRCSHSFLFFFVFLFFLFFLGQNRFSGFKNDDGDLVMIII